MSKTGSKKKLRHPGASGTPGTCLWCGVRFTKVLEYRETKRVLVKGKPPTRCTARARLVFRQTCGNREFLRDPLPNPEPWSCSLCHTQYAGRYVRTAIGPPKVMGDTSRWGMFCTAMCGEAYGRAAVRLGLILKTGPNPNAENDTRGLYVTEAKIGGTNVPVPSLERGAPAWSPYLRGDEVVGPLPD